MYSRTETVEQKHGRTPSSLERAARTDHLHLDQLFEAARSAVVDDDGPRAIRCFAEFRLGVMRHIHWEESALFGPCTACAPRGEFADLPHHHLDHAALRKAMDEILCLLLLDHRSAELDARLSDLLDGLEDLLGEHLMEEVEDVCKPLDETLPDERTAELSRGLHPHAV